MDFAGLHFCILILTSFISFRITGAKPLYHFCLYDKGNYTANTTYQANLDRVLSSVSKVGNDYGFYNMSVGENSDTVNAIALCRGDVKPNDCLGCISNATIELKRRCPNQKEAIIWYDYCMFRYSNRSIFGILETGNTFSMHNVNNVSDVDGFDQALSGLFTSLRSIVASGSSLRKFAAAKANATAPTIYAFVQCTPDLSELECNNCLIWNIENMSYCTEGRIGGRVIGPSCIARFEPVSFIASSGSTTVASPPAIPPSHLPPSTGTTPSEAGRSSASKTTIIIVISTTVSGILIICFCICIFSRVSKSKKKIESADGAVSEIKRSADFLQYDFGTIRDATDNFSNANKLGQGGFGAVYKGTFPNRQEVAVKRLSKESSQGEVEFKNEVMLLAKLHHRSLVRLLGYCYEHEERLLIYEFMPNSSLDNFLSDHTKHTQLDWRNRYKIIYGIARGLFYLHEESQYRIIHRDLKASNILLDAAMNAKIGDFGTARLFATEQTQNDTSRIVGTYGYMAPEYVLNGRYSAKSDVYSFGVIVLEVVRGQNNRNFRVGEEVVDLKTYTWQRWNQGAALDLIDPTLGGPTSEMLRCIHIGLLCVQENAANRPTMSTVILMLNSCSYSLPVPSQPGFYIHNNHIESDRRNVECTFQSVNEVSITELYPR